MTRFIRPLLLVCSASLFAQCAQNPPPELALQPTEPTAPASRREAFVHPLLARVNASVEAFERGDRDATYHHLAVVWLACGPRDITREVLPIAIATELDPTNRYARLDRAADFAAAYLGRPIEASWANAMARALEAWIEAFGGQSSDVPELPASPAPLLHMTVRRGAEPQDIRECEVPDHPPGYTTPARLSTSRNPSPAVAARIVELEASRLRLSRERVRLGSRAAAVDTLEGRIRELEQEVARLRELLTP